MRLQRNSCVLVNPSEAQYNTIRLVGLGGFEPPTSPLSGVRSNQLSYRPQSNFDRQSIQLELAGEGAYYTHGFLIFKISPSRSCDDFSYPSELRENDHVMHRLFSEQIPDQRLLHHQLRQHYSLSVCVPDPTVTSPLGVMASPDSTSTSMRFESLVS